MNKYLLVLCAIFTACCVCNQHKNKKHNFVNTPVEEVADAVKDDDYAEIMILLKDKPDSILNYQNAKGRNLLHYAYHKRKYEATKALVESGVNMNVVDKKGHCPMIDCAANWESDKYIKLFLNNGGDPNIVSTKNTANRRTPLIAGAYHAQSYEYVKLLIEHGADPHYVYRTEVYNMSCLQVALSYSRIKLVNYLIFDLSVNYKDIRRVNMHNETYNILYYLRKMLFDLNSEKYKEKMRLVNYLKSKGLDYSKEPVPKHFYDNYSKEYLGKY